MDKKEVDKINKSLGKLEKSIKPGKKGTLTDRMASSGLGIFVANEGDKEKD